MVDIIGERVCAEIEGEIVVFLIGMRINRYWKFWRWIPVLLAMPRMLRELAAHPELGMLSFRGYFGSGGPMMVQYWKSADLLQAYAQSRTGAHLPAWRAFNGSIGTNGDVGIWHETYVVPPGHLEALYVNMPRFGLGLVGALRPAQGRWKTAAQRLGVKPGR